MNSLFAGFVVCLFVLFIVLFGVGALCINLKKNKDEENLGSAPDVPKILQEEARLETANPADLIAHSARADELERQSGELADNVRKRIRDRARQTVSRESGTGVADNS